MSNAQYRLLTSMVSIVAGFTAVAIIIVLETSR
jgi:hypothetical protein